MSEPHQEIMQQFYDVAMEGNVPLLEDLLAKGARIDKGDITCGTPLHHAIKGGKLAAVRYLVEKGADKEKIGSIGTRFTPLGFAAYRGFSHIMQYLQEQGCLPVDNDGRTVLHCAAYGGKLVLAQQLVEQGADLEALNQFGQTALYYCATYGYLVFAQYLVTQGANKDAADQFGNTALHAATGLGRLSFVRYLHQQGAEVEKVNAKGLTPLHVAAEKDELGVMQYLLEEGGADRNKAITDTQDTALHIAAAAGHHEIVSCLFTHLADLTARNRNGQLPIDVAKNDKIRQLITAEELGRRDHGHKRAREEGMLTPTPAPPAKKHKGGDEEEEEEDQPSEASEEEEEE